MVLELLFSGSSIYVPGVLDSPSSSAVYLFDGERKIIIDPGGFASIKNLEASLNNLSVEPESITDVLLTHFHLDHAFNSIFFNRATVHLHGSFISKDYASFGPIIGKMYNFVKSWHKVEPFDTETMWDCIEVIKTPFHSRDHVSFMVDTENSGKVLIAGDLCDRQYKYYEMKKGMRDDKASDIFLELFNKADTVIFSHDYPILKR